MLLGEALALRADLKKRTGELKARIASNARHQEGEPPGFDVRSLVTEFEASGATLCQVIQRINRTNAHLPFDGATLADALIERDRLGMLHAMRTGLAEASAGAQHRQLMSELKSVAQVKASESQEAADQIAKARRELDVRIQAANWANELLD